MIDCGDSVGWRLEALFTALQAFNHNEPDKWWKTCLVVLNHGGIKIRTMTRIRLAYPSFRLSPIEAGLTDILGWVEMELCDWLLVKDDVSRLTGDIGGVGLLPSECVSEPGVTEDIKKLK